MKLNYKILWIDDRQASIRADKKRLEDFFHDYGIELYIEPIEPTASFNPDEDEKFKKLIKDYTLDMVFVDYKINEDTTGESIIKKIRSECNNYYTPILFYTSDSGGANKLFEIVSESNKSSKAIVFSDGIYFCHRDNLFSKAECIFNSYLMKEQEPQRVRGLLMDRVSEIEAEVMETIEKAFVKLNNKNELFTKLQQLLSEKVEGGKNKLTTLNKLQNKEDTYKFLNKNKLFFDSNNRVRILLDLLNAISFSDDIMKDDFKNKLNDLIKNDDEALFKIRNLYGHETAEKIRESHTDKKCVHIRNETRNQLNNLINIKKALDNV